MSANNVATMFAMILATLVGITTSFNYFQHVVNLPLSSHPPPLYYTSHHRAATSAAPHPTTTTASTYSHLVSNLSSKKSTTKKKKKGGASAGAVAATGGGFGGGGGRGLSPLSPPSTKVPTISADKNSLEKQWDIFTSITDLEIKPKGSPDDEDYVDFEVVDVFVRCGGGSSSTSTKEETNNSNTGWFRIGKVCALPQEASIDAALKLQKGLIFWTAVHMRRELVVHGGKAGGAASLQLGYISPPTMIMGNESDPAISNEEEEYTDSKTGESMIQVVTGNNNKSTSFKGIKPKTFGFRPDWNPTGFTYKRREKAGGMKKKKSSLEEMKSVVDVVETEQEATEE